MHGQTSEKLSVSESPAKKRKSSGGGGGGGGGASSVANLLKKWKGYFSSLPATFGKWLVFEEPCYTKDTSQEDLFKDILSFVHLGSHYNSHILCSHFLLGKALSVFLEGRREAESRNKAIEELNDANPKEANYWRQKHLMQ